MQKLFVDLYQISKIGFSYIISGIHFFILFTFLLDEKSNKIIKSERLTPRRDVFTRSKSPRTNCSKNKISRRSLLSNELVQTGPLIIKANFTKKISKNKKHNNLNNTIYGTFYFNVGCEIFR